MDNLDTALDSLIFLIPLVHLLVSPYTKVEESFALQATHDILVYGTPTSSIRDRFAAAYDHFTFPGAVPRTFVGPVVLAGVAQPLVALVGFGAAQLVVRAVLGALNAAALMAFRRAAAAAFGRGVARWWVVLLVSQFHVAYYLTRTLPNMFAFPLTTLAAACLLPKPDAEKAFVRQKQAIGLLVLAGTIFRSEIAILLATNCLYLLATKQMNLRNMVPLGVGTFVGALLLSVPVDSYFWQKPLWPELWGFYYNAIQGSSSEWGVSPWHYYFTSALPRLLLNPLSIPLMLLACFHPGMTQQARGLAIPALGFVAIYSLQPHKEARFIFYVIPALTGVVALGANFVWTRRAKSVLYMAGTALVCCGVLLSAGTSAAMLLLSSLNYPGGDALEQVYRLTRNETSPVIPVHADVLTCMTGLSLFGQNHDGLPVALGTPTASVSTAPLLLFDKLEDDVRLKWPSFWKEFDYSLVEDPKEPLGGNWEELGVVCGYDGIEILRPGREPADVEAAGGHSKRQAPLLGKGALISRIRDTVRGYTGGWWAGPRMSPRIHILKRQKRV